jgi:myo-inositol 2-dehydrogenase / D-chiro-inositol 1-dehydrogenase
MFKRAFDNQVQVWADAARRGQIGGPSAWDGYQVAVACAAGVEALANPGPVALELPETPAFYAAPAEV